MTRLANLLKAMLLVAGAVLGPALLPALSTPAWADTDPGVAAEAPSPGMSGMPQDEPWEFKLGMYGWFSSVDADVSAGGSTSNVHASFSEIFQRLGWAVMASGEVRYERAILLLDTMGLQIADGATSNRRIVPINTILGAGVLTAGPLDVHARSTLWMLDVKAGWRALHVPLSKLWGPAQPGDERIFDADVFLGLRYWNVDTKLSARLDPATVTLNGNSVTLPGGLPPVDFNGIRLDGKLLRGGKRTWHQTVDWVDPLIGLRLRTGVTENISVMFLGDIGGFDIGSASKFTWQALLGANWAMSEHWNLILAYRGLGLDRSNALENTTLHGPLLGIGFRY